MLLLVTLSPALAGDYEDAVRLLKQGDAAAALKKVDAAIAADKNDARSRFLKGLILTEQNNTPAAIEVFTDLTRDYPELPEPYNNLAVLYAAQGKYNLARESLEMAIRTHPSYAVAHENLGDVYAKMASEAYDKALSLDRGNQTAQTKLSLIRELFSGSKPLGGVQTAAAANANNVQAVPPTTPAPPVAPTKPVPPSAAAPSATPAQPVPPAQPATDAKLAVIAAVNNWAEAWSNQDVKAYLSHYAADFSTPGRQSRSDWENQRRSRLKAPKFIKVGIADAVVSFAGENSATVRFRQHYQSDTIDSTGYKTLTLAQSDGRWLIVKEQFEN
jgi:tetratricopeptide (TPR) repeat protein